MVLNCDSILTLLNSLHYYVVKADHNAGTVN